MPTHLEPFGVVFLEAMQASLPIIATKVGAVPDFIKDNWNGILVEPGDIDGIANGLIKLLENPILCQQLDRCFQKYVQTYHEPLGKQSR